MTQSKTKKKTIAKIESKLAARVWLLDAIQKHQAFADALTQSEIKRFIRRMQREIKSLEYAKANLEKSRKREIADLVKSQKADAEDRRFRFESAIRK